MLLNLMTVWQQMDFSRRDAFRPRSSVHQATKANFVLLAKENCN